MNQQTITRYQNATMYYNHGSYMLDYETGLPDDFWRDEGQKFNIVKYYDAFTVNIGGGFGCDVFTLYAGDEETCKEAARILNEKLANPVPIEEYGK